MASSDDFKKQLKAGNIVDALATALSQALELEITTWVASSSESDIEASSSGAKLAKPGHRLQTRINLIEGKIDNEIGNQFIGNGPYRELRQFHQEQVADGHKIIQNNLNSLQKLFGILVRIRQPNPDALVIEHESSDDIGSVLPPADKVAESTLQLPDAVHPSAPTTTPEPSSLGTDEDWEDWGVEAPSQRTPIPSQSSLDLVTDENWEDWSVEEPSPRDPQTSLNAPSWGLDEDWGDMLAAESTPAALNQSSLDWLTDEDWGDMLTEPIPAAASREVSSLETDEDWRNVVEQAPELSQPAPSNSSFEEWPADRSASLVAVPVGNGFSLATGIEEHWEEFEVEALESQPVLSEAVSTEPTPPAQEDIEDFDALADLISLESELNQDSDYDLLVEDFEEDLFAQPSLPMDEGIDSPTASSDSLVDLFGESSLDVKTFPEASQHPSPTTAENTSASQMLGSESYSTEDVPTKESSLLFPPPPPQNQSKNQSSEKQGG